MKFGFILICSLLLSTSAWSYQLRGVVIDDNKEPLPGVSIYLENSTYGVITNAKGAFTMELDEGNYTLVFRHIGFKVHKEEISIPCKGSLQVSLLPDVTELEEVAISAKRKDPAYELMKNASDKRTFYLDQYESVSYNGYIKAFLEKEELSKERDSVTNEKIENITIEKMNMVEKVANFKLELPNNRKETVIAFKNYSDKPVFEGMASSLANYGFYFDEVENYDVSLEYEANPLLFSLHPLEVNINLYNTHVHLPELNEMPFISPLHPLATASYKFKLIESFKENEQIIYKIEIIPRRPADALFGGHIYLVDEEWAIKAVDLSLPKQALSIYNKMQFLQNYAKDENQTWLCEREEFFYESTDEEVTFIGNTIIYYSDYNVNAQFDKNTFKGEVSKTEKDAVSNSTALLNKYRPITLKEEEVAFVAAQDSIALAHSSPAYLMEQDSSYNHTSLLDVLLFGIENQNSLKGRRIYILPVIDQLRLFQPGGYRHAIGGTYTKFYKETGRQFDSYAQIDYGFLNRDLRGHYKAAYTFNSFNFSKISVGFGSEYELMNQNQSAVANLSPGNYNLINHLTVGYDREYINGLFINTQMRYAQHNPVTDLELPPFTDTLIADMSYFFNDQFSSIFNPIYFDAYTKLTFNADIAIRIKQEYRTTPVRKIILGSKYPKINLNLTVGVPSVLGSISNFGYAELRVQDRMRFGSYGYSQYNVVAGSFLWSNAVQLVDEKFFIGGDIVWFTNPLRGQQLLGQSLRTTQPFAEYHYRHNFDGSIMNKVPLFRALRLGLTAGSNALFIANDLAHIETYYGFEKKFRIGNELLKAGFYVINGTNSDIPFTTDFRLGLSAYNPVTKSWM